MVTLSTTVLAALGGLLAILLIMFRQSGKKEGAKQAKQESAGAIAEVKVGAINEKADQIQSMPAAGKYTAVLKQFLQQRRAARLGKKN